MKANDDEEVILWPTYEGLLSAMIKKRNKIMTTKDPFNKDPITNEIGAQPVGTSVGTTAGAISGAALGAVLGPVGMIAGAVAGGVAGGLMGKEIGEMANPTAVDPDDEHPVGTGVGAGAGAIVGAVVGSVAGPVGTFAGSSLGAAAGSYLGRKGEEAISDDEPESTRIYKTTDPDVVLAVHEDDKIRDSTVVRPVVGAHVVSPVVDTVTTHHSEVRPPVITATDYPEGYVPVQESLRDPDARRLD